MSETHVNNTEAGTSAGKSATSRFATVISAANNLLRRRWAQLSIVVGAMTVAAFVIGQTTPPAIPPITLSADPLFAAANRDKPAMALALSVEYPTVGAQYVNEVDLPNKTNDSSYTNEKEYLGYYDAEACYNYNNAPTETVASGLTTADYKRFDRVGPAIALSVPSTTETFKTSRKCANAFSGNYLNWASNSGIDMLRLALSGGDRYIDQVGLTVLQRAVIPNGDPICMWNTTNFPAKQLRKDGGGAGTYYGAVPTAMITAAAGSDIWVANTLDRIYFGTTSTGGCGNTAAYSLGGTSPTAIGPVNNVTQSLPTDAVTPACAGENGTCSFTGVREVWYGAGTKWAVAPASNSVSCSNGVFGDPLVGTAKACYTRAYSGSWTAGGGGALNSDGFFYSRVQVCNAVSGVLQDTRDYGLCARYGTNFKPTGTIQKYSEQLRLASFGYLMDQTASYNTGGRFGGVLRAPMKYVGAKTFDATGRENTPGTGNPNAEWDPATGIFYPNPDGDTTQATPISGVINYLNKFGRTGPVAGRYKIYDPVGELYYQSLRYLQGLPPSPDAISGLTPAMYDGFPVATSWADPYGGTRSSTSDYSCVKSNIVVVGDVNTHDGNRMPATNLANNIPDINGWTGIVRAFENNSATAYTDGQGVARTTGNPNTANGSSPSNIVMGAAYWAHTQDIRGSNWTNEPTKQRPGLRVKSYFFDVNEYSNSTDPNYRRNQNQFFMGAKYGGFQADPSNRGPNGVPNPFNTFGNPFKSQDGTNNNNVWQDPARPGEAKSFYLQSNARGVLGAFDEIFKDAVVEANSIAGLAVTSSNVRGPNSTYIAAFNTDNWSGQVSAIPITASSTGAITKATATWTATFKIDSLPAPATSRNIIVGRAGASTSPTATQFTWAAILDQTLKNDLSKTSPTAATDTLGQDRLNYLRGDRSKEGSPFRLRASLLGDIVNSGIAYSGTPTGVVNGGTSFATFRTATAGRTPAVFVGANDGMLHAFNAGTGDELFGYIPSWMGPKLSALTVPSYYLNHQAYVDASPAVDSAKIGAAWKTVLVSGTGAGGRGVFALDVTDPASFGPGNVMWEFTQADDADMGFVLGKPQILQLRTTAQNVSPAVYKWFAVVASGVNNYVPDSANVFSTTGRPALFLLDLSKSAGTSWVENSNYYKLSVPTDATLAATNPSGLINFESVTGPNGELQSIYLGDLFGKLWKLDFTLAGTANWNFNFLSFKKSGSAIPMFIAKTSAGVVQPITGAPTIIKGPRTDNGDTFYVAFGTGKYIESTDKTSAVQNSVYTVYDNGVATSANAAGEPLITGRARLQQSTLNPTTRFITPNSPIVWGRATSDSDATQKSGWYFDFGTSGERQIFAGEQFGALLKFSSLIPAAAGLSSSCAADGTGGNYNVNFLTGGGSFTPIQGIPGQPVLLDNPDSDVITKISDSTGRRLITKIQSSLQGTSRDLIDGGATTQTFVAGRLSWRQINNYQERKNAP